MAITNAALTSGKSTTDTTAYTTASVTPTANGVIVVHAFSRIAFGGIISPPTITGLTGGTALNWQAIVDNNNSNSYFASAFWARTTASPGSGTITITFPATQSNCQWHVFEFAGTNTNDLIGNVTPGTTAQTGTAFSATLAAFASSLNGTVAAWASDSPTITVAPEASWTEIYDTQQAELFCDSTVESMWRADNDTTPTATGSASSIWIGFAYEINDVTIGGGSRPLVNAGLVNRGLVNAGLVN